jgi:hypothetical protein
MSEIELRYKERLVLSIEARIRQLVYQVQDDGDNMRFKPGCSWWLAAFGNTAKNKFPEAVHFCDQIGVSQEKFEEAFGRRWLNSKKAPFSDLRSRMFGGFNFVTIGRINLYSDYGNECDSPASDRSLIVSSSSSWAIPSGRLLYSIEERVTPIPVQEPTQAPANTSAHRRAGSELVWQLWSGKSLNISQLSREADYKVPARVGA